MEPRKAEDVGTRIQHYMELQDMWSSAFAILTRPNLYHSPQEELIAARLEIALELLENHMRAEFSNASYAKVINDLPKDAKEIRDE